MLLSYSLKSFTKQFVRFSSSSSLYFPFNSCNTIAILQPLEIVYLCAYLFYNVHEERWVISCVHSTRFYAHLLSIVVLSLLILKLLLFLLLCRWWLSISYSLLYFVVLHSTLIRLVSRYMRASVHIYTSTRSLSQSESKFTALNNHFSSGWAQVFVCMPSNA